MDLSKLLQQFGLTESESGVYLAALKFRAATPAQIADVAGIKRTTAYHAIETLVKKGLVSIASHGPTLRYRAEPPEQLQILLERRASEVSRLQQKMTKALPLFPVPGDTPESLPQVDTVYGVDGLKNLADSIFRAPSKEVLVIAPSFTAVETANAEYAWEFMQKRSRVGITTKSIWVDLPKNKQLMRSRELARTVRLAPASWLPNNQTMIIISGTMVITLVLLPEVFGIKVKSFHYSQIMKAVWQALWNISTPVKG